ncbi:hypothetical protein CUMW_226350 [Citrus unshiu]|uniref:PGG domain-containing protein n=1 Tax=Citrus unshiu TaxID=55188 RepID=A0A2H5QFY0_CITUN|nr:hypothetical protein CUMW_226350 [Citrus unshiu]
MNPDLYRAAAKGEIEPFNETAKDELVSIADKNTVLHVNIASQQEGERVSTEFVEGILEMCPSLLLQVNDKGDTPLHVAAKCRHPAVVEVLIKFAKKQSRELESGVDWVRWMLLVENEEKNTALHEAVQSAAKGSVEIVAEILENCPSADHRGPDGLTTLHAAVICNAEDVIKLLLEKKKILTRERDLHGWTSLHHAAYLDDRGMTALHLAASQGHERVVRRIIRHCPESYSIVDNRGWNALHFAMVSLRGGVLKSLLENPYVISLIHDRSDYRKVRESHLVVAALIATVAFAAAFTIPGGYKSDNGTAILRGNTAFQAFIISDTIAMVLSLSAVFIHFVLSFEVGGKAEIDLLVTAFISTMTSMGAMVIAFVTGTYAMLATSLGLAIITCFIGLTFFLLALCVMRRAFYIIE